MSSEEAPLEWWNRQHLVPGEGLFVTLDALDFCLFRSRAEWQVAHRRRPDSLESETARLERVTEVADELDQRARFASDGATDEVQLLPRVADRSVVARPRVPLHVLPGESGRIYMSSPVWLQATVGESGRSLVEVPVRRLSDTWFGPSTREGVVAYSLKTHARTRAEDMPHVSYRVVTPVAIRNDSEEILTIDRLNLPVPLLSIYCGSEGRLWTEAVELRHSDESGLAALDVRPGAPAEAEGTRRLSGPRERAEHSLLVRAFSTLLRPFESGGRE